MLAKAALAALVTLTVALSSTAPALAQVAGEPPLTAQGTSLTLDALGHSLVLPQPTWIEPGSIPPDEVVDNLVTHYLSDERQVLLEIYPRGEGQALWSNMLGARIALEADRPLKDYRSAVILGYARSCQPQLTGFFQFRQDEGDVPAPLGFVCGAYLDLPGYAGQGEVMVMVFRKTDKGVAVAYQEWRGKAFDPADPKTWPVDTALVQQRAEELDAQTILSLAD